MSPEMKEKIRAGQIAYLEKQAAVRAALRAAEKQKQEADWNRLAGTEEFVQRCISTHRRFPGCEFPEFAVEMSIPNASAEVKKRLREQLAALTAECAKQCANNFEGRIYHARLKAAIAIARTQRKS